MSLILQVFYSIVSGLLLSAAIPNDIYLLGFPLFAFIALCPYFIAISNCKGFKQAFLLGFCQTISTHLVSSYWLAFFKDFAIFTLGASALATGIIGGFMAIYMYLPFSRSSKASFDFYKPLPAFYTKSAFRIFWFAAIYTLYEYIKSSGFLGYPWGTVSSAMYNFKSFTQLAAITGTYGITFLTAVFNALLGEFLILLEKQLHANNKVIFWSSFNWSAITFALLFASTLIYGRYELNLQRKPVKQITTIFVQQNDDPWEILTDDEVILNCQNLTIQQLEQLKNENKKPQLIVWSEGSLKRYFPGNYSYYKHNPPERPFISFIKDCGAPLIAGGGVSIKEKVLVNGEEDIKKTMYNSALVFDANGNYRGYYGKLHLVPFAESIPGIDNPKIKAIIKKVVGISAGWHKGEHLTYFDIPCTSLDSKYSTLVENFDLSQKYVESEQTLPTAKIAIPICYDDAFTDVIRPMYLHGAELFVNITNDSWSLRKSSEYQHFCIASYRAIEYRTTLLRSTNAGYSVVLDPCGRILADQPLFTTCAKSFDIPVYQRSSTFYAKFGNWLPYFIIIFLIVTSVIMAETFVKNDYIPSEKKNRR